MVPWLDRLGSSASRSIARTYHLGKSNFFFRQTPCSSRSPSALALTSSPASWSDPGPIPPDSSDEIIRVITDVRLPTARPSFHNHNQNLELRNRVPHAA